MVKSVSPSPGGRWLLFLPQLPAKPDYARVKLWRRLQPLGAVALRNGVYVLPHTPEAREDLEWVAKEVATDAGSAVVCEATLLEGISDAELQQRFRERSTNAYRDIAARARAALGDPALLLALRRLRAQFQAEVRRDHFDAAGRVEAEHALGTLDAAQQQKVAGPPGPAPAGGPSRQRGTARPNAAVWVTRAGVFVDRIASAWLIKRFIDRKATFKFVTGTRYAPRARELRFDMFQAEYTHRGDRCTFEVLLDDFGLTQEPLRAIAEIVHDIDLKDERYGREETAGIAQLLHGLCVAQPDDVRRVRAGAQMFDSLFAQFSTAPA
jgi:hypothetical protein